MNTSINRIQPLSADGIGLADEWADYLSSLDWGPGNRDRASFSALLRAGTLKIPPDTALEKVAEQIGQSGGRYSQSKLQSQQRRAYEYAGTAAQGVVRSPEKLTFQSAAANRTSAKASGITREWIKGKSPISCGGMSSAQVLNHLYLPDERVLIFTDLYGQGESIFKAGADPISEIPTSGLDGVWFLVNPVSGKWHPNPRQNNKDSRRSEESILSWRYIVIESDKVPEEQWLSIIVQLPLRISAIYSSGGKSIHALVRVDAASKQDWDAKRDKLKRVLVPLGADEGAMTGVRLSRLPNAMRGNCLQELLYLNPDPQPTPIFHHDRPI